MIEPGTRLGPYEVLGLLGAGGMGEVYRGHDPRLSREVAIKVLPDGVNADPDRLRRFEQEARVAGALNHPNILVIYDVGVRDGAPYVVSELLEGETLRARLRAGALPIRDAIGFATEIAHGLAAAHEKGIVHRDLKPENLLVTTDGRVKILDFGLAKLSQPEIAMPETGDEVAKELTTASGTILGTAGYMSPEQVRGQPVDHRSDVFSYGAVLYEMLCGRRAFHGETPADTLSAILRQDPPELGGMGREIPPALERITRRCLEKDPAERFQSARDVAFALEAVRDAVPVKPEAARPRWAGRLASFVASARAPHVVAVVTVSILLAAWLLASLFLPPPPTPQIAGSTQLTFTGSVGGPDPSCEWFQTIVTDGTRIYFSDHSKAPGARLAYMSRAGGEPVYVPSPVESSHLLGLSPDGGRLLVRDWPSIAHTEGALWVVPTSGGAPKRLGDVIAHAAAWSPDGRSLVYARGEQLHLASADGGQARTLATTPGWPQWIRWSPDGRNLRFTLTHTDGQRRSLWEVSADGTDLHVLPLQWDDERRQECCGEWSRDGRHFVFMAVGERGADLWMLDETAHVFRGRSWKPRRLTSESPYSFFAIPSLDGKTLYAVKSRSTAQAFQYDPRSRQLAESPFPGLEVRFSRDDEWLAYVEVRGAEAVLKRSKLDGSQALQLTTPPLQPMLPSWSPDGKQIAFTGKSHGKPYKAYVVSHEGGALEPLLPGERNEVDLDWSPDGRSLMFGRPPDKMAEAGLPKAIHIVDLKTKQVSTLPHSEGLFSPRWSRDGRHVVAMTLDQSKLVHFDFTTAEWTDLAGAGIGVGVVGACRPNCHNPQWSLDGRHVYVQNLGTDVLRVTLADRSVERVLKVADLGPTIKRVAFDGLTLDGSVLLAISVGGGDIHALEWRVP